MRLTVSSQFTLSGLTGGVGRALAGFVISHNATHVVLMFSARKKKSQQLQKHEGGIVECGQNNMAQPLRQGEDNVANEATENVLRPKQRLQSESEPQIQTNLTIARTLAIAGVTKNFFFDGLTHSTTIHNTDSNY
ncbi:hypothetical protein GCG54_00015397 [Colletotrichum gloeosporioides]|uniref:Uncharacterized protein n=1 Tax=Colletotrichum gloeosporioides TaxID=474922 RepID=A0A8H4CKV3_COLGL|nr:uncharacterized protein GCG54_00015397 [Colletotrichum gloeosporioides]KAF3805838.1 hypothetical protein GCG54_00015397 [Colletotrichum gloeosporioides]